ncbi:uncharacterized protein [Nicotiana sylvestris]|uniref:uncharacterized protein isoform X1 n=1 Tax=Nicotiana sylvestris TaxID=4096 RepID=UPI00388C749C
MEICFRRTIFMEGGSQRKVWHGRKMDKQACEKSIRGQLWKSIRNLWPKIINKSNFRIGNGLKVSFWEDNWLGQGSLKQPFPDIYLLNQQQEATVAEVWTNQGWTLTFRRLLNDWEINKLIEFYKNLERFKVTSTAEDRVTWQGNSKGKFSVKAAYKEFNISNNQIGCWPWKLIWKVKIPYKVACFTLLLAKEAVLTPDNLIKRGFQLCSRCYLRGEEAETINHLFLHYRVTLQLRRIFINLRGILWVMPRRIPEVLTCGNREGNLSSNKERKIVPACIWWTIWEERNQRCFEDRYSNIQKMKMKCLVLFYFWCKGEYLEYHEFIFDVLESL